MKPGNGVLSSFGTTIFEVMSRLAIENKAVNLGQGFPDGNGPDDVRAVAHKALDDPANQYPPMMGVPELRQAIAAHDRRFYGIDVDWQSETMVASGATEVLASTLFGLLEPGDEIVMFEPLYDSYVPIAQRAGADVKLVRLRPPDWKIPMDQLANAFGPRTKAILLNSPLNPAGKVFSHDELAAIAELVTTHDVYAICDEVYEHIVFDSVPHIPLMTFPGMRERSVRIASAGKTFSLTGWKVGYATASADVLAPIAKAHQFLTFTTPPNLQRAVAFGLGKDDDYFSALGDQMQTSRDRLATGLTEIGFTVAPCKGTYFLNADFTPLGFDGTDVDFCRHITTNAGVAAVPVSAFYFGSGDVPSNFARFCFCKEDRTLDEALRRLRAHFSG